MAHKTPGSNYMVVQVPIHKDDIRRLARDQWSMSAFYDLMAQRFDDLFTHKRTEIDKAIQRYKDKTAEFAGDKDV